MGRDRDARAARRSSCCSGVLSNDVARLAESAGPSTALLCDEDGRRARRPVQLPARPLIATCRSPTPPTTSATSPGFARSAGGFDADVVDARRRLRDARRAGPARARARAGLATRRCRRACTAASARVAGVAGARRAAPATPARTASSCCSRPARRPRVWDALAAAAAPRRRAWARATRCASRPASRCTATTSDRARSDRGRARLVLRASTTGFIGAEAVARGRAPGPRERLVAVRDRRRRDRAPGQPVAGRRRGHQRHALAVPGASASGMAYVPPARAAPGTELEIDVRGTDARRAVVDDASRSTQPKADAREVTMADASYPDDLLYHPEHDWARHRRASDGDVRDHLVRAGRARRGGVLRAARGRQRADRQGRALRRGRVGEGRLRRDRAAVGRGDRGQRRARRARPRRSTRTPTATGWLVQDRA